MTSAYESGTEPVILWYHRCVIARDAAKLSQDELAALIGVSRNTITNYERGRVRPRRIVLNAWALACGVPVSWIVRGPQAPPAGGGVDKSLPADTTPPFNQPVGELTDDPLAA